MAKSKSRHKHPSAAQRNGSGGNARTAPSASKTTVKDESTTTLVADKAEEKIEKETSTAPVAEDAAQENTEQATPTTKATSAKTATKGVAEDAASTREAGSKSAKTVPATPAPGKTRPAAKAVPNTPPLKAIPTTPTGSGKAQSRDAAKYERRRIERQTLYLAERRARRNRILIAVSIILAVVIVGAGIFYFVRQSTTASQAAQQRAGQGSFQEPIFNSSYPPVDSVYCDQLEQSVEHIHVYIVMYIDGKASPLPAGVGIPQDSTGNAACFYWLHTHDSSGILHIESPSSEVFTFGQFRDEWQQQFVSLGMPSQLLLNSGWKIWINGKVYNGTLSSIPLDAHNIITLAYNSPNVKPATTYNWNGL